jgi:hypothetical protein
MLPSIDILGSGQVDNRDSAFPQAVQIPNGDLLCSFNVGGGAIVTGGSDWARSTDGGETWTLDGTILPPSDEPRSVNALKLSISTDGETVYAYGSRGYPEEGHSFGHVRNEAGSCKFDGSGWSEPQIIPMPGDCPLEISHGILPLASGCLLAPAAVLPSADRLAERVYVAISDDNGATWPSHAIIFQDPNDRVGYFEQKLAEISPSRIIATGWTVTLGNVDDRPNSFVISEDDGLTWSKPASTGINGQTMTPIPLGGDRLLILYNRRYGNQGIVMALATMTKGDWEVEYEGLLFDAQAQRTRPENQASGTAELDGFNFGFPTAIRLADETIFVTHWSRENRVYGVRWVKLKVNS